MLAEQYNVWHTGSQTLRKHWGSPGSWGPHFKLEILKYWISCDCKGTNFFFFFIRLAFSYWTICILSVRCKLHMLLKGRKNKTLHSMVSKKKPQNCVLVGTHKHFPKSFRAAGGSCHSTVGGGCCFRHFLTCNFCALHFLPSFCGALALVLDY